MPPSPEVRFLLDWKLNAPASPSDPTFFAFTSAPWAWAQSSITFRPCFRARAFRPSMSAGCPARWTGSRATVSGRMAASAASTDMV